MPETLQQLFGRALLNPDLPAPAGLIAPGGGPAGRRYDVYRNNVVAGLGTALADSYPLVRKLVGEDFFRATASEFVRRHPPQSPLMMQFGDEFPVFLAGFPPAQDLPYLPDAARLEIARRQAFHAADAAPLPADALARFAPGDLAAVRLSFHPSFRLVSSAWPVFSIWRWNMTKDQSPLPPGGEDVLVARPFGDVEMRLLPSGAAGFLAALALAGTPLGTAVETAVAADADFNPAGQIGGLIAANITVEILGPAPARP